jgi:hypothetical protein
MHALCGYSIPEDKQTSFCYGQFCYDCGDKKGGTEEEEENQGDEEKNDEEKNEFCGQFDFEAIDREANDPEKYDLEKINPPNNNYHPPIYENEKGELQKHIEKHFVGSKKERQYVMLLAMMLLDINEEDFEPYKTYSYLNKKTKGKNKSLKPQKDLLIHELKRRNPKYRPNTKNKTVVKLVKELDSEHMALTDERDIEYVKYRERLLRKTIGDFVGDKMEKDANRTHSMVSADRMRVILCFQDDAIVEAYRKSQNCKTRMQLDGRKSNKRAPSFEDLVIAKFNNPGWVPTNQYLPDLHADFADEKEYPKREEYTLDIDKLHNIMSWEKQKIMTVVRAYEKSGNGSDIPRDNFELDEEGLADEEEEIDKAWGHYDSEAAELQGGDNRKNFLRGNPSDVLYWWHVLDELQLLTVTCVMFKRTAGADSHGRPDLTESSKKSKEKRSRISEQLLPEIREVSVGFKEYAAIRKAEMARRTLSNLRKEKLELQEKLYITAKDAPEEFKQAIRDQIEQVEELENSYSKEANIIKRKRDH